MSADEQAPAHVQARHRRVRIEAHARERPSCRGPASPTVSAMPQARHEPRRRGRKGDVDDQRDAERDEEQRAQVAGRGGGGCSASTDQGARHDRRETEQVVDREEALERLEPGAGAGTRGTDPRSRSKPITRRAFGERVARFRDRPAADCEIERIDRPPRAQARARRTAASPLALRGRDWGGAAPRTRRERTARDSSFKFERRRLRHYLRERPYPVSAIPTPRGIRRSVRWAARHAIQIVLLASHRHAAPLHALRGGVARGCQPDDRLPCALGQATGGGEHAKVDRAGGARTALPAQRSGPQSADAPVAHGRLDHPGHRQPVLPAVGARSPGRARGRRVPRARVQHGSSSPATSSSTWSTSSTGRSTASSSSRSTSRLFI